MTVVARRGVGSASIWVVACCALLLVMSAAIGVRSLAVLARHRAESAADLAALAAAGQIGVDGSCCAAARGIAAANGALLTSCRLTLDQTGRSGSVVVRVSYPARLPIVGRIDVAASARAGRMPA